MLSKQDIVNIVEEKDILKDLKSFFIVVDRELHVLFVNYKPIEASRQPVYPGDLLKCCNSLAPDSPCGCQELCKVCGLRATVNKCFATKERAEEDVPMRLGTNEETDFHVVATPFVHEGKDYAVVLLIDRTSQHRQRMLERIFFHDLLNLSGVLNGLMECTDASDFEDMVPIIKSISKQFLDEVRAQRDLIYAHNGILEPVNAIFSATDVMTFVEESFTLSSKEKYGVDLKIENHLTNEQLNSDHALVNRVINNMIKNACEANSNSTIVVRGEAKDNKVIYSVHNDAVMDAQVKSRVFLYGHSTKGANRGMGTYSMKLIGENYLGGKVYFKSEAGFGTEFYFELEKVGE